MKIEKTKKWDKMITSDKATLAGNVELMKIKINSIEDQLKMKEFLLANSGGTKKNPEVSEEVSDLLCDAIRAKLSILNYRQPLKTFKTTNISL